MPASSGDNWDMYVMNSDGSGQIRLTDDPGIDAMPAWLPDGSGIVFRSTRGGVWAIWIMNPDGSKPRKISRCSSCRRLGAYSIGRWVTMLRRLVLMVGVSEGLTHAVSAKSYGQERASCQQ